MSLHECFSKFFSSSLTGGFGTFGISIGVGTFSGVQITFPHGNFGHPTRVFSAECSILHPGCNIGFAHIGVGHNGFGNGFGAGLGHPGTDCLLQNSVTESPAAQAKH